jgi:hypothetical protein
MADLIFRTPPNKPSELAMLIWSDAPVSSTGT